MIKEMLNPLTYQVTRMHPQASKPAGKNKGPSQLRITKSHRAIVDASLRARLESKEILLNTTSVQVLGLSGRAYTRLRIANINTVEQLINCTESTLLNIPHVGVTTAEEIKKKLNSYLVERLARNDLESHIKQGKANTEKVSIPSIQKGASFSLLKPIDKLLKRLGYRRK